MSVQATKVNQHKIDGLEPLNPISAGIDLGSGEFKICVSKKTDSGIEVALEKVIKVALSADLEKSGEVCKLSPEIEQVALNALFTLKEISAKAGCVKVQGIATEVFRKAKNGSEVLKRLSEQSGIPLTLLSGEEEGRVGFEGVFPFCSDYNRDETIVFAAGSGSFQVTFKEGDALHSISFPLGTVPTLSLLQKNVRKKTHSPEDPINPVTSNEVDALVGLIREKIEEAYDKKKAFFKALEKKLTSAKVLGIGYGGLIGKVIENWPYTATLLGPSTKPMNQETLYRFITALTNRANEDPRIASIKEVYAGRVVPSTTMLYAVMKVLNFPEIEWRHVPAGSDAFHYFYSN